jgi:hypothetical protein
MRIQYGRKKKEAAASSQDAVMTDDDAVASLLLCSLHSRSCLAFRFTTTAKTKGSTLAIHFYVESLPELSREK